MTAREVLDQIEQRAAEAERHASPCGPCDGGLPMACTCATDPRATIADLLTDVRSQYAALKSVLARHRAGGRYCTACGYPWPCPTVRAITEALGGGA